MISVEEAQKIIKDAIVKRDPILLPLEEVNDCVLAEDIQTDRDYPPFNKSIMDGICIDYASYDSGERIFPIQGIQAAGLPKTQLSDAKNCFEIMTGAVIPDGCDCVIPIEKVMIENGQATVQDDSIVTKGQFITRQGNDSKANVSILKTGDVLTPPRIAFCASVGKSKVFVEYKNKIAIVSTGDEIVRPDENVEDHQIRSSNDYFIKSLFEKTNRASCDLYHLKDDEEILTNEIKSILENYDCVVLSGGVSMGKFDLVPKVLEKLNVKQLFHKVTQKPGKPMWFGVATNNVPVFGLPGNPVSTYTCSTRYVREYLIGNVQEITAISNVDFEAILSVTEYKMVSVSCKDGKMHFEPIEFKGSGDLTSITQSDGFIEIPIERGLINKGDVFKVYVW